MTEYRGCLSVEKEHLKGSGEKTPTSRDVHMQWTDLFAVIATFL